MISTVRTHLSPKVEKAIFVWVSCNTRHTGHPADDERFYWFVWTVAQFSIRPPSEKKIRDLVISK
jgi:hypothetical protein